MNRHINIPAGRKENGRKTSVKFREWSEAFRDELKECFGEIFTDFVRAGKRRRKRRMHDIYGSRIPADRRTREVYFAVYALKKSLSAVWTAVFSVICFVILVCTVTGTAVAVYLFDIMKMTDTVELKEFVQCMGSGIYEKNAETGDYELIYKVNPPSKSVKLKCDFDSLPDYVKNAFVSVEDERFYAHEGVDYKRTAAAIANLMMQLTGLSDREFGGSTITQQLIKNITGDSAQTPERKAGEIFRAMKFEKRYTKDDILEAYLNEIQFDILDGYQMYGIEAASVGFFGKSASELSVAEAAVLAAMPKSPGNLNPAVNFDANRDRKEFCLYKMFELGYLSADEYEEAMNERILISAMPEFRTLHPNCRKLSDNDEDFENPDILSWSLETALTEISEFYKEKYELNSVNEGFEMFKSAGVKVYLSTDPEIQKHLEDKYSDWSCFTEAESDQGEKIQSAVSVLDYKGHVLGVVSEIGKKKSNRGHNIAVVGGRQPGSTIKPVTTYSYALEKGLISYSSYFYDTYLPQWEVPDFEYWPQNYDGNPRGGRHTAEYFLRNSINTLPAQIVYNNGNNLSEEIFEFATEKMHLDLNPETDCGYAPLCIGATAYGPGVINLANAYMPFGNEGKYYKASIISRCVDAATGETVIDNENREPEQAVSSDTAYIMTRMLENVIKEGTGKAAALNNAPLAGKTGTTENWRDIAFVGCTPDYISAVWLGYSHGTNRDAIIGSSSAGIWKDVFGTYADSHWSGKKFPECDTVLCEKYCALTGERAGENCPYGGTGYFREYDSFCASH